MKIIKYFLTLIIALLAINISTSQEAEKRYKDKIIMHNGSILIGSITEYNPDDNISLELKNGKIITFNTEQVKRVIMNSEKTDRGGLPLKTKRIFNETQFSLLSGVSGTGVSFAHNIMYQYDSRIALGLGTGIDNYYVAPGRDVFPLFANAKFNLLNKASSPYIGMKYGFGFVFKRESENLFEASGGVMYNPYFGIRLGSRGVIWNLFSGIKLQKANYEFINSWETRSEEIFYKRLEIGTSIMF